mgnify:FL=1
MTLRDPETAPRRANESHASFLLIVPFVVTTMLALAACAEPAVESPMRAVVGEKALMTTVLEPAADLYWAAVGEIVTAEGVEQIRPQSDEEWVAVRNAAVVLAESGNLLLVRRRARDEGAWLDWSRELTDAGEEAMRAAESRDPDAVFDVGERVYFACRGCHEQYWPEGLP